MRMGAYDEMPLPVRAPLRFPVPRFVASRAYVGTQKAVDNASSVVIQSGSRTSPSTTQQKGQKTMQLTKAGTSKNGKAAFYDGAKQRLRIPLGVFAGGQAPDTIDVPEGLFEAKPTPKYKMTAEERKAARAAAPKLTLAEKIAKREEALARLKAKAAQEAQAQGQPAF